MSREKLDSSSGLVSIIAGFVEHARAEGAMAPIALTDMESPQIKPPAVNKLCQDIRSAGFRGKILTFSRLNKDGSVPIGVPLNLPEDILRDSNPYFGLYIPPDITPLSRPEIQRRLDKIVDPATESNIDLPFKGKILVTDSGLIGKWQSQGMWPVDEAVLDPENAEFSLNKDPLAKEAVIEGRKFMEEKYLPALLTAVETLRKYGMIPAQLSAEKNFANIFLKLNGIMLFVDFSGLINTDHSQKQREIILKRDVFCRYPATGIFPAGNRYSIPDLIQMDRLSGIRQPDDPKRDLMGTDDTGFYLENKIDLPRSICGLHIPGRYLRIPFGTKSLRADWGDWQLHHIIARGAAFMALLTGILKDDIEGRETPGEMMFYLRAARVRDLVSVEKAWPYYADRQKVLLTLSENIENIDRAVNSPYNMVALCRNCHQTLAHPDMPYANSIADFIEELNKGAISLSDHAFLKDRILKPKYVRGRKKLSSEQMMYNLHLARQLVLSVGQLYQCNSPTIGGGDTSDQLLDYARGATKRYIREQKEEITSRIISLAEDEKDPLQRSRFWHTIHSLQCESPEKTIEKFYIHRDLKKVEQFRRWLK